LGKQKAKEAEDLAKIAPKTKNKASMFCKLFKDNVIQRRHFIHDFLQRNAALHYLTLVTLLYSSFLISFCNQ